jgi:tRNA(fMet)-specific endonuclease VapC
VSFVLDTNICSAHLRRPTGLAHRFVQYSGRLFVPSLVVAELFTWAYRSQYPAPMAQAIETFLRLEVKVLDFDEACGRICGQIRGQLMLQGISVASVDLMIASVALVHDYTLVTHNVHDFQHVPKLRVVDWLAP